MPMLEPDDYRSYLLRIWRVKDNDIFHWRAVLERVDTGERMKFEGLDALVVYLEALAKPESEEAERDAFQASNRQASEDAGPRGDPASA